MIKVDCSLCKEIANFHHNRPLLVHEFTYSFLMLGKHQFYPGYCLLIFKNHVRELHELLPTVRKGLFDELMICGEAINQSFTPWKLNYACYGNLVEHIHWHIIPRYASEPRHREEPFCNAAEFDKFATQPDQVQNDIYRIRNNIQKIVTTHP